MASLVVPTWPKIYFNLYLRQFKSEAQKAATNEGIMFYFTYKPRADYLDKPQEVTQFPSLKSV
jgi:hypothetical protein